MDDFEKIRIEKKQKIKSTFFFHPKTRLKDFHTLKENQKTSIAGRIIFIRNLGKISFIKISNVDSICQIAIKNDFFPEDLSRIGLENYENVKKNLDLGDLIGAEGTIFKTNAGEKTLNVSNIFLLSKCLKTWPEKWAGITDPELKIRQRYLDIITNEETRYVFNSRLKIIEIIREILKEYDFVEVETPILQKIASGAAALPFSTHHNAMGLDLYLRIAPELFLKQLIIAGYDRVFEIGKCFRNEGIDPSHLQEFTMLEFYITYVNYEEFITFSINFIQEIMKRTFGELKSFNSIPRISYQQFLLNHLNIDFSKITKREDLIPFSQKFSIDEKKYPTCESLLEKLYKIAVKKIKNPILIYDYPSHSLGKSHENNPNIGYVFQLIVEGIELFKAYMELNDSEVLKDNFNKEKDLNTKGEEEFIRRDASFEEALSYGMPVTGGFGMGIDRLITLLLEKNNLRDTIFFPLSKDQK